LLEQCSTAGQVKMKKCSRPDLQMDDTVDSDG